MARKCEMGSRPPPVTTQLNALKRDLARLRKRLAAKGRPPPVELVSAITRLDSLQALFTDKKSSAEATPYVLAALTYVTAVAKQLYSLLSCIFEALICNPVASSNSLELLMGSLRRSLPRGWASAGNIWRPSRVATKTFLSRSFEKFRNTWAFRFHFCSPNPNPAISFMPC